MSHPASVLLPVWVAWLNPAIKWRCVVKKAALLEVLLAAWCQLIASWWWTCTLHQTAVIKVCHCVIKNGTFHRKPLWYIYESSSDLQRQNSVWVSAQIPIWLFSNMLYLITFLKMFQIDKCTWNMCKQNKTNILSGMMMMMIFFR